MGDKWTPDEAMKRMTQRNAEALTDSAVFVAIFNDKMVEEVLPLIQMGLAVYLDKPIYILCPESRVPLIPENVRRLARKLEIFPDHDMQEMHRATERLLADAFGNPPKA